MSNHDDDQDSGINKYTINLNQKLLHSKSSLTGRLGEITEIIYTLLRIKKNNPLLIGHPGVGKTALVHELVRLINNKKLPKDLNNRTVYQLDINALQAGCAQYGEIEKRIMLLIKKFSENKDYILFIDEIHQAMVAGSTNTIGDLIKPYALTILGATTVNEYRKHIEGDGAFRRRFNVIHINEPDFSETIHIARGAKTTLELHFNVKIADKAIYLAAKLGKRFFIDRYDPDLTLEILEDAACTIGCSKQIQPYTLVKSKEKIERLSLLIEGQKIEGQPHKESIQKLAKLKTSYASKNNQWLKEIEIMTQIITIKESIEKLHQEAEQNKRDGNFEDAGKLLYLHKPKLDKKLSALEKNFTPQYIGCSVEPEDILKTISRKTGIASDRITSDFNTASAINKFLKIKIIGQNHAIDCISENLKIAFSWFRQPSRPLSIMFFAGHTGTGKTEAAKQIAQFLSNMENLTIIDMSKYSSAEAVSGLIGSQKGYVGYGERGELTGAVQQKRLDQVIVLDEIEKAHKNVFNLLLSIFDRGIIFDSLDRAANFRECIFILTSNIILVDKLAVAKSPITSDQYTKKLEQYFSLEFINRLDSIIHFKPFASAEIDKIILSCSSIIFKNFEEQFGISIKIEKAIIKYIANKSNQVYGAREINRLINEIIISPLINFIHDQQSSKGLDINTIYINYANENVTITSSTIKT